MRDRSHDDAMAEMLRNDPEFAVAYLNELIAGGYSDFLIGLRQVALAHDGGVRAVAKDAELNANQLYRTLSEDGNPNLRSLGAVLNALGFRLAIATNNEQHQQITA